ncbi:hypothetical protein C8K30_110109 [Promicromonospora sp. AC04]|uniref:plasmid replication, integration and excision activator n=1 Tax=Promicromonospora sp. AC04 TaxID=2135723 RepID=UPI000D3C6223|nr:plasmid replication, integration and excision activator [Promicromonospora sp. AC04]PUB23966.1 hypothetical protein C8K30_110109 [Promicromonospora sp. AC04]
MAMQRRFAVAHGDVFPAGAVMKGEVQPVGDFDAPKREDGSRPQQLDKETGLPLWQVVVADLDDEGNKSDAGVSVKIPSRVQPVPPVAVSIPGTPITLRLVEFVGLTALPYVDDNGNRPRLAWSYKAEDICAPGKADVATPARPDAGKAAA